MLVKILLIFLFSFEVLAITLNSTYYIDSRNIKLQDILPRAPYDVTLFKIEQKRYTKRVKSKEVIALLQQHGFKDILSSSSYILFTKNSPIDTSKIKSSITSLYKEKYPNIKINSILVMPRGYVKSLPKKFELIMQKKSYLSRDGTLSIKTLDKKKLFFDYTIDAKIYIYVPKKQLKRRERISALNTRKKSIQFHKFKAMPINEHQLNITQSKRNLKVDTIITLRDIETLNLVRRGSHVSVNFKDNSINISFSAKALQNGKLNDIITIEKRNKKRLKVRVIGKNRVEVK